MHLISTEREPVPNEMCLMASLITCNLKCRSECAVLIKTGSRQALICECAYNNIYVQYASNNA